MTTANIAAQATGITEVFNQGDTTLEGFGDIMKHLPGYVSFTGLIEISAPELNSDQTSAKLYNGKKKYWLTPIHGARQAFDYQTGQEIVGAASIEVYVNQSVELPEGIHKGLYVKARHGSVPAFDFISESDARMVIEAVGGSIMYTPLINRQASGLDYDTARGARKTAQLAERAAKGDVKAAAYLHTQGQADPKAQNLGAKLLSMFTA